MMGHEISMNGISFPEKFLLYGCGNMAGAMLAGWIRAGIDANRFFIIDPFAKDLPAGTHHLERDKSGGTVEKYAHVLLGIKPQMLAQLAPEIETLLAPDATVISILAGSRVESLRKYFRGRTIARLMPNLAAAIGKSPMALHAPDLDKQSRNELDRYFAPLGETLWIDDEGHMDAVTALAGSGPAFVYRFIAALAEAGVELGLPAEQADRLARSMVEGAATLAAASAENANDLAARVTSPGGTTAAGLAILDSEDALRKLVQHTLAAATQRGVELSKEE